METHHFDKTTRNPTLFVGTYTLLQFHLWSWEKFKDTKKIIRRRKSK